MSAKPPVKSRGESLKEKSPWRAKFAQRLVFRRKERGYKTAYAFFYNNGGDDYFDFSYHHYLLIEKGMRLPSQAGLKAILEKVAPRINFYAERKELLFYFLKALLNGDSLFEPVFDGVSPRVATDGQEVTGALEAAPETAEEQLLNFAAREAVSAVPLLTDAQKETVLSSPEKLWIYQLLLQFGQKQTAEQLAGELGVSTEIVQAAAESLVADKLLEKRKDGGYFVPGAEADTFFATGIKAGETGRFSRMISDRAEAFGQRPFHGFFFLNVEDEQKLAQLTNMFREFMRKAYLFRPRRSKEKGTLVSVEGRISPLFKIE